MNAHRNSLLYFKNIIDKLSWQILDSNKQQNNQQQQNRRKNGNEIPDGEDVYAEFLMLRRLRKLVCFFSVAMFVNWKVCNIYGCRCFPVCSFCLAATWLPSDAAWRVIGNTEGMFRNRGIGPRIRLETVQSLTNFTFPPLPSNYVYICLWCVSKNVSRS